MTEFEKVRKIMRARETELEGEGDIHGAAIVADLIERIEEDLTEEAEEYECSCEEDPDICPFHGAPL